jgi:hypothetical protein
MKADWLDVSREETRAEASKGNIFPTEILKVPLPSPNIVNLWIPSASAASRLNPRCSSRQFGVHRLLPGRGVM